MSLFYFCIIIIYCKCLKFSESSKTITDTVPQIVWREDQEYFLVNYFFEGKRKFKVFKYPCTPYFENEDVPGLQAPIAWRCIGNMIACPVWTNNIKMSIFEKNGLLRHSFVLCKQVIFFY